MAIDFRQVKAITIPEGDVKQISINGVVVWSSVAELVSITLSGQITSLDRGSAFSFGGTVTATYSNGATANVTSSTTFSGYNMSTAGTYTVTASYTENGVTVTATYSLTVNKAWTQVWSGSWTSWQGSDFTVSNIVQESNIKLRITMTYNPNNSTISQNYLQYNPSATKASSQTSAKTYTNTYNDFAYGTTYDIAGISASNEEKMKIAYKGSKKFGNSKTAGSQAYKITVTKIEQYY